MLILKVKVICLPYNVQVLYVLCFTRPTEQVSVYRTTGPLVVRKPVNINVLRSATPQLALVPANRYNSDI